MACASNRRPGEDRTCDPRAPTLRCLHDDLRLSVPPIDHSLDEVEHLLLSKVDEQFATATATGSRDRIAAIDDNVFFKAKVQHWRGAVWVERDLTWLVAAIAEALQQTKTAS